LKLTVSPSICLNSKKRMHKSMYSVQPATYYLQQMSRGGLRGAWFKQRQLKTRRLVKKYYRPGGLVLDIGCGNCLWNTGEVPVIGIDICESMLCYNKDHVKHFFPVNADVFNSVPLKDASIDIVVMTEILEHLESHACIINEVFRVLKKDGILIVSVPYGKLPGLWQFIFPLWCRFKWWKDKDEYYKYHCGHVSVFNLKGLARLFNGFNILENGNIALLTIFLVLKKN